MIPMCKSGSAMSPESKGILALEDVGSNLETHALHRILESISAKMLSDQSPHKAVLFQLDRQRSGQRGISVLFGSNG
jgi:hypothetical protein